MPRALILLAAAMAAGCVYSHSHQPTFQLTTPEAMRAQLAAMIPPGTNLSAAQATMEREGFTCHVVRGGTFIERTWFGSDEPRHEGLDFLACRRVQSAGHLLMSRNWDVALVFDGDQVTQTLVSHYIDGP